MISDILLFFTEKFALDLDNPTLPEVLHGSPSEERPKPWTALSGAIISLRAHVCSLDPRPLNVRSSSCRRPVAFQSLLELVQ